MLITTTIYLAETKPGAQRALPRNSETDMMLAKLAELEKADRQWVSIHEGKNRVLPLDEGH